MSKSCVLCDGQDFRFFGSVYNYDIVTCNHCGLKFVHPMPSPEVLHDFYNSQAYHSGDRYQVGQVYHPWDRRMADIRSLGYTSGHILDVGCATGHFLSKAASQGFGIFGIDVSETAIEKAKATLGEGKAQSLDLLELPDEKQFDIITMWALIEHLREPDKYLIKIGKLLKPNGLIAFSTPNISACSESVKGSKWKYYIPPEHLYYFDTKLISRMLKKYGFEVIRIRTYNNIPAWVATNRNIPKWYRNKLMRILFKSMMSIVILFCKIRNKGETMEVYARKI